jgi:protein SCO1/2
MNYLPKTKRLVFFSLLVAAAVSVLLTKAIPFQLSADPATVSETAATSAGVEIVDAGLVNQDGEAIGFAGKIAGDKIVAMNFIYTDCRTACPVTSAIFAKLQNRLGERLGHDVMLVSITMNPNHDTAARLKAYAAKFNAGPGWVWLTGDKKPVDDVLKGLGVYTADYSSHSPVILLGDPARGLWMRLDGFTSPETMVSKIDELLLSRS